MGIKLHGGTSVDSSSPGFMSVSLSCNKQFCCDTVEKGMENRQVLLLQTLGATGFDVELTGITER